MGVADEARGSLPARNWRASCCHLVATSIARSTGTRSAEEYKLKNTTLLCAIAISAAFAGHAEAIYKCATPKGVVYQDRPCREGTESDVTIVIPTGEMAPRAGSAQDDSAQPNVGRQEGRFGASKQGRIADEPAAATKPADNRAANPANSIAADQATKGNSRVVESLLPMTADEARKNEPTAKYYTTDGAAPGTETPEHMTCESPTGEKRRFILTNGKMTSI
jgi:hypothetical protein